VREAAKAIEETTGYPALSVLNDSTSDGVIVGATSRTTAASARPDGLPRDPLGLLRRPRRTRDGGSTDTSPRGVDARAASLEELGVGRGVEVPLADAYSLRVNVSRRLYDRGIAMQGSPALGHAEEPSVLALNHFDLDRLGVETGDLVG
jgi:hypothetical protein